MIYDVRSFLIKMGISLAVYWWFWVWIESWKSTGRICKKCGATME